MLNNGTTDGSLCGVTNTKKEKQAAELAIGFIVAILNIIEIILISKLKRKKRIYELFLLSLSCSDFLFGLANILMSAIFLSDSCQFEDVVEGIFSFYLFVILASILHLSWITLDRFCAVKWPFKHRTFVTRRKIYKLLGFTWFITITITVILHLTEELTEAFGSKQAESGISASNKSMDQYKYYVQMITAIFIVIADVVFIFCYGNMVYIIKQKSAVTDGNTKKENKISIVCIFIAASFITFTSPYAFSVLIDGKAIYGANLLLIMNSGMNCIVYFFRSKCEKYIDRKYQSSSSSSDTKETKISHYPLSTTSKIEKSKLT